MCARAVSPWRPIRPQSVPWLVPGAWLAAAVLVLVLVLVPALVLVLRQNEIGNEIAHRRSQPR